jgi:DNA-binding response OmpR family regulator
MRILLVEDEHSIRVALSRGLGRHGHQVEAVASLAEARERAGTIRPEALVSDLKLPDGSGLDLAEELGLPFILMTGYGTFDDAVRAMRLGAVDFFTKPASIQALCQALEHLAGRHGGGPTVLDTAHGLGLVQPGSDGIAVRQVLTQTVEWRDQVEARQVFDRLVALLPDRDHRLVAAELMQAAPAGRLVVNLHACGWSAWLAAGMDWSQQAERRQLIEDHTRRCVWRADGALVECGHV